MGRQPHPSRAPARAREGLRPVHLTAAARGADDAKPAFLSDAAIATSREVPPRLTWERADANHATLMFEPAGAAAVAEVLSR